MNIAGLHRFALFVVFCTLLVIVSGAAVTSAEPLSATTTGLFSESGHRLVGSGLTALALILTLWTTFADKRSWMKKFAWVVFVAIVATAGLGEMRTALGSFLHALLAPLFLSAASAVALFTSGVWNLGPEPVQDYGWPSMRSLAISTPVLILIQVALGAMYRHKVIGLMAHLIGAMLIALMILLLGVFVLQQFPTHRTLRPAAIAFMTIGFTQVALGLAALTARSMGDATSPPVMSIVVAHVTVGALTLAASIVTGILIRRNVYPKPEED